MRLAFNAARIKISTLQPPLIISVPNFVDFNLKLTFLSGWRRQFSIHWTCLDYSYRLGLLHSLIFFE